MRPFVRDPRRCRVRFWIVWNGSTSRLALCPGQRVSLWRFERHEEGWTLSALSFEHIGQSIECTAHAEGIDADGRFRTAAAWRCPLDELGAAHSAHFPEPLPAWVLLEAEQRDFRAEASGY
jgi:hypothetical protein